jgi:DNA-binding NarL/FixJ family response regulator
VSSLPRRRVAVVDDHEIFRLGICAALAEDPSIEVVYSGAAGPLPSGVEVAVVSARVIERERLRCPVVVCADELPQPVRQARRNRVSVVLDRGTVTSEQLIAGVRAAAAGLHVNTSVPEDSDATARARFDPRRREVLRLLAEGADTYLISQRLCYSVRTIKSLIADIEHELCATSRAHAVAEGIRRGII